MEKGSAVIIIFAYEYELHKHIHTAHAHDGPRRTSDVRRQVDDDLQRMKHTQALTSLLICLNGNERSPPSVRA